MTSTFKSWYDTYRDLGVGIDQAKRKAFTESTREDEMKQVDDGVAYADDHVRLSIVHARSDIALMCYELYQANNTLRSIRRWLVLIAVLLVVAVIYLARGHS